MSRLLICDTGGGESGPPAVVWDNAAPGYQATNNMITKSPVTHFTAFCAALALGIGATLPLVRGMDNRVRADMYLPPNAPGYKDIAEPTNLPPGVPPAYNPNGTYFYWGEKFTTKAYQKEALTLVLQEANKAARELHLPERLPITVTNLTAAYISRYGGSRIGTEPIGNVSTKDYCYYVSLDHKLSFIEGTHQDQDGFGWTSQYKWPWSRIDTNTPYRLATQWLDAVHMDVAGLNRDCEVHVVPDTYWNNPELHERTYVPIYDVYWLSPLNKKKGYGDAASVTLFLPTKTLTSLRVEDPNYILRPPIVFTNLYELLSDTNRSIPLHFPMPKYHPSHVTNDNPNL
jgi:hypothetical protein